MATKEKKAAGKAETPAAKDTVEAPTIAATDSAAETKSDSAPPNYSRGEGQKPVTQAYRDNWDAIYGKKKKK